MAKTFDVFLKVLAKRLPEDLVNSQTARQIVLKSGDVMRELARIARECCTECMVQLEKIKAVFPDEESVFKLMYLARNSIAKRWTRPIKNWRAALSHFPILFPERFKI